MRKANVLPYEERQHGQIYYCKCGAAEYFFQWNEERKNGYYTWKGPDMDIYKGLTDGGSFDEDWQKQTDQDIIYIESIQTQGHMTKMIHIVILQSLLQRSK